MPSIAATVDPQSTDSSRALSTSMWRTTMKQTEMDVDMTPAKIADANEELIMEEGRSIQPPQMLPPQNQAQFSLAPAIYTPFQGFDDLLESDDGDDSPEAHIGKTGHVIQPSCATEDSIEKANERVAENTIKKVTNTTTGKAKQAIDNDEHKAETDKLAMIIARIKRHQEVVKENMIYLSEIHLQNLQNHAQHQVEQIHGSDWDDQHSDITQEDNEREERLNGNIWERLSAIALEEEEAELGEFLPGRDINSENTIGRHDVQVGGTKFRVMKVVYEELGRELMEVIEGATLEVEVYGEHAEENLECYKSILIDRLTVIDSEDPTVLMGYDTVMGGTKTTEMAADALDSVLSPAFDFGSPIFPTYSRSPAKANSGKPLPPPIILAKIAGEISGQRDHGNQ